MVCHSSMSAKKTPNAGHNESELQHKKYLLSAADKINLMTPALVGGGQQQRPPWRR